MADIGPNKDASTEKPKAILEAAFGVFAKYGYRRTSMQDIAVGAGMSRAALYLHYRNKEDIFRTLSQFYYSEVVVDVARVLDQNLDPQSALLAAFEAHGGKAINAMLSSPHGAELMDTKHALGADVAARGEAEIAEVYTKWLTREAAAGRIDLAAFGGSAQVLANTMISALYGLKGPLPSYENYCVSVAQLAALFGRGLAIAPKK